MTAHPITIVTVTRNNLDGLRRTFASLAEQTFRDVQHVVIDGGSTDGSVEWLAKERAFDDTVVVSEPDRGVYDAMNKGARLATGELLNFMNAGDGFAQAGVLARVAASQAKDRWQWGFGLARVLAEDGRPVKPVRPVRYTLRGHALGQIAVSHQATFMRTELFRELDGFDLRFPLAGDTHLLLRAGRKSRPAVWDDVDVLYFRGGVSDRRVFAQVLERHRVRRSLPGAALTPWPLDLLWTVAQAVSIAVRKAGKRALELVSGGRFTRWWARRGL